MIPEVPIRRLFRVVNGGTPTPDEHYWDGGIPWITPEDLSGADGGVIGGSRRTLSKAGIAESSAVVSPPGSLVVSTRAPVGYVAELRMAAATNQGCRTLVPYANVDTRFFRYALVARRAQLQSMGQGSTFQEVSAGDLARIHLPAPDRAAQRVIADYLDRETAGIDALVEKKQRLLALTGARFWSLVDSLIVHLGNPVPLARDLVSACDGPFGSELASAHYAEFGARVVRLGNIGRWEFRRSDEAFISDSYYEVLRDHNVEGGDLLVAALGDELNPLGRACVAPPGLGKAIVKADCFRLRLGPSWVPEFVALWFSSDRGSALISQVQRGSTRQRANIGDIAHIAVPRPTVGHQAEVVAKAARALAERSAIGERLERQIQLLRSRRHALITTAVSGQISSPGVA